MASAAGGVRVTAHPFPVPQADRLAGLDRLELHISPTFRLVSLDGVALRTRWVEEVSTFCDPIFDAAQVGFVRQVQYTDAACQVISAVLWEANPVMFAARYPDSGIIESYGEDQWQGVQCIDYWFYVDHEHRKGRISVEGWNLPELLIELHGEGGLDGSATADVFARILGVGTARA